MVDPETLADELIDARARGALLRPFTERFAGFGLAEAYAVLAALERRRRAEGWRPVGRKIGFTNRTLWDAYGVEAPLWARVWDRTLRRAPHGAASVSVGGLVQPRIETEVAFGLSSPLEATDDPNAALAAVAWMAPAFEIVVCPFPDWRFGLADCTAAFGLHALLVLGPPVALTGDRRRLLADLAAFRATVRRDGTVEGAGSGADVLGSPAHALAHLSRVLAGQPTFEPLRAGEIVTTGTVTDARPLRTGRWRADYGELGLPPLTCDVTA